MGKQKRINWMLVITGVLLLVSVCVFVYKFLFGKTADYCLFEEHRVEYGKEIISSSGSRCVCGDDRKVVCDSVQRGEQEESFSTDNLVFEYSYLNTISADSSDSFRVFPVDINQNGAELTVIFEREGLCSDTFEAPSQAGYYQKYQDRLVLSTITSGDTENFNIPCLMSNSFKITNFDLEGKDDYEIYYKNEKGKEFNLMACLYKGVLYGQGDVFTGGKNQPICTCEKGEVVCK